MQGSMQAKTISGTVTARGRITAQLGTTRKQISAQLGSAPMGAAAIAQMIEDGKIKNYNQLDGKPSINGVELSGDKTPEELHLISEGTTEYWNSNLQYVPRKGEIVVYTDHTTIQDEQGNDILIPGIKIGDGNAYLIDMPFIGDGTRYLIMRELHAHEDDLIRHITQEERDFWNAKLNYDVDGDELILNRD